ncbi:MAG: YdcF family protein, partial [Casimicrobiaceae bacterium]
AIGCAGERIIIPVPLMDEYPHLKLLFAGGSGQILSEVGPEADVAAEYFARMGVDMTRVVLERESRNTFENARNAALLPGVDPKQKWLLVTSAWHMPRAMATFRKAGWNVTAYPVDWMSSRDSAFSYDFVGGAFAWETWLRERVGLMIYAVLGWA